MQLGDQIQYVRRLKKMERKEVADKLGISPQQYSKYENNESTISSEKLDKLSHIFGIDREAILQIDTNQILQQINTSQNKAEHEKHIGEEDIKNGQLITRLLDYQGKVIDMLEKRLSYLEGMIKTKGPDKKNTG